VRFVLFFIFLFYIKERIFMQNQKNQKNLRIMIESAAMIGLAVLLSHFKMFELPFGGSITMFSMIPLVIIALRHGLVWGLASTFVYSVTYIITSGAVGRLSGWGVAGPRNIIFCLLFDYIVAYMVIGLAGLFKPAIDKTPARTKKIAVAAAATLSVCILRYISHNISAVLVFYGLFADPGENVLTYLIGTALAYNATYMLPETIITLVAAPAVVTILAAVSRQKNSSIN